MKKLKWERVSNLHRVTQLASSRAGLKPSLTRKCKLLASPRWTVHIISSECPYGFSLLIKSVHTMGGPFLNPDDSNKWTVRKWNQRENLCTDWLLSNTQERVLRCDDSIVVMLKTRPYLSQIHTQVFTDETIISGIWFKTIWELTVGWRTRLAWVLVGSRS